MKRLLLTVVLAGTATILTGCATASNQPGADRTPSPTASTRPPFQTTTPGPIATPGAPTGVPTEVPAAKWDAIIADLANRGVTATPTVVTSEAVTFNDGSLGCGSPGQSYTQALVDGMRVVVTADGTTYDYRFDTGNEPKLCLR